MTRRRKEPIPQAEERILKINIWLRPDAAVEIDPEFNKLAIDHLDKLYEMAQREDYENNWTDDHKIAFFLSDMIDSILVQYDAPIAREEVNGSVAPVPHITEAPVRDVFDINRMGLAKPGKRPN